MLFPIEPEKFWQQVRLIIREELSHAAKKTSRHENSTYETPGLNYKPLYRIGELCQVFSISRLTIYSWIKDGKLKPFKIRRRVYFLWNDIQQLLQG